MNNAKNRMLISLGILLALLLPAGYAVFSINQNDDFQPLQEPRDDEIWFIKNPSDYPRLGWGWEPMDEEPEEWDHKMHYPQLPDPNGWDVRSFYFYDAEYDEWILLDDRVADDWLCTESGFITSIHWWGSWFDDVEADILNFTIEIYSDVPANVSEFGFSEPGDLLWSDIFHISEIETTPQTPSLQGWIEWFFDRGDWIVEGEPDNHVNYTLYSLTNISNPFYQVNNTIYWLSITAEVSTVLMGSPPFQWYEPEGQWGWKTSGSPQWNDNAVLGFHMEEDIWVYHNLTDPLTHEPVDLAFVIESGPLPPEEWDHKMHYPQLPDPNGWDVFSLALYIEDIEDFNAFCTVADDWMCTESGFVTDITWWGSWMGDVEHDNQLGFYIGIWSDSPANETHHSRPDELLWDRFFTLDKIDIGEQPPSLQGWYDPDLPMYEIDDHFNYFRYELTNISEPFYQENNTIYWLSIIIVVDEPEIVWGEWGWKTSLDHWNDYAVWGEETMATMEWGWHNMSWHNLTDPVTSERLDLAFVIGGESLNYPPDAFDEDPTDLDTDISIFYNQVSVNITDPEGDTFNVFIHSNYLTNVSLYDQVNGTFSANLNTPLPFEEVITWHVDIQSNSSNMGNWANYTFTFTTEGKPDIVYVNLSYNSSTPGWEYDMFDNIPDAIDGVAENGTVYVYEGIYNLTDELYIGKPLTMENLDGAKNTIIQRTDGNEHRLLKIEDIWDYYVIVDGFTFQGGYANMSNDNGVAGNIYILNSINSTVQNSIIRNGYAEQFGGGVQLEGGRLYNCSIYDNVVYNSEMNAGGGVSIRYGGNIMEYCYVMNNSAPVGGGMMLKWGAAPPDNNKIRYCTISNNTAHGYLATYYGGGIISQGQGHTSSVVNGSIVYYNTPNNIVDIDGSLNVYYTCTTPSWGGSGSNNIDDAPEFEYDGVYTEPEIYYALQYGSPCVDTAFNSSNRGAWQLEPLSPPDIVYVNLSYNSSTPGWEYDMFDNIPDAIDGVAENGTVYVYEGIYDEGKINIDKVGLNLTGESKDSVILNGGFNITIDNIKVSEFSISGFTDGDGISISSCENILIENCIIYSTDRNGIFITNTEDVIIENNNIYDCNWSGIKIDTSNTTIRTNTIVNNTLYGIEMVEEGNLIYNNYFNNTNNAYDATVPDVPEMERFLYYGGYSANLGTRVVQGYLTNLSTKANSPNYGTRINSITGDEEFIYVGGQDTQTVRRYWKSNMSYDTETPNYNGAIHTVVIDDEYIYAGGATTQTIRKYWKGNMSYIGESASYDGVIDKLIIDGDYIYAGGQTTQTVRRYWKTNLSYVDETPDYGGRVYGIDMDDTYVYVGGMDTNRVRRYWKTNLSYVDQAESYGNSINSVILDDEYIYIGGTTQKIYQYWKANMTKKAESTGLGSVIYNLVIDGDYIYSAETTPGFPFAGCVRRYWKSNLSYIDETPDYDGGNNMGVVQALYIDPMPNPSSDGNIWNISKTQGTNIVGGPYLGGNYWHDYMGEDTTGDGLGDTLVPYNSNGNIQTGGDNLPLIPWPNEPPDIPVLVSPVNTSWGTVYVEYFNCTVFDPDEDDLTVYFYWGNGTLFGTVTNASNGPVSFDMKTISPIWWLDHDTTYTWYVVVDDGVEQQQSETWTYHTAVAWDLNLERVIDALDVSGTVTAYGTSILPGEIPADINDDGNVDALDVSLVISYYGTVYLS